VISSIPSIAAALEERLLTPARSSRWGPASIAAHRGLALPLQLVGPVHRWTVQRGPARLRLAGIGREELIAPIFARLFGQLPQPTRKDHRVLWSPSALIATGADMVIAEVHRWAAPRLRRAGWLTIPQAIRWQGDLSRVPPTQPSRSLEWELRQATGHGFTISHTTAPEDWDEFYREMVVPQARSQHQVAWVPSHRLIIDLARAGTLHLVSKDGERVAGTCSLHRGGILWLPLVSAIRRADPGLLRMGAGTAALALTLDWARLEGYSLIDAGRTGPFVNDPWQQLKRKWGLDAAPDPLAHVTAIWSTSAVRDSFSREPVLIEDGETLRAYCGEVA
jgi:hypothetical protein